MIETVTAYRVYDEYKRRYQVFLSLYEASQYQYEHLDDVLPYDNIRVNGTFGNELAGRVCGIDGNTVYFVISGGRIPDEYMGHLLDYRCFKNYKHTDGEMYTAKIGCYPRYKITKLGFDPYVFEQNKNKSI